MHWGRLRELYEVFECGMKAGSASSTTRSRAASTPTCSCSARRWACGRGGGGARHVPRRQPAARRHCQGDAMVKAVSDFALYLINRNLTAADVVAAAPTMDFPQSVFELLEGGSASAPARRVQMAVLKGAAALPGRRSSARCRPPTWARSWRGPPRAPRRRRRSRLHRRNVSSSLLYPKVFADYVARQPVRRAVRACRRRLLARAVVEQTSPRCRRARRLRVWACARWRLRAGRGGGGGGHHSRARQRQEARRRSHARVLAARR